MGPFKRKLESFYDQYATGLYLCALAVTGCSELAEDAIHEAFCRLLKMRDAPDNLKAYVFRSVRNAAIDQLRRQRSYIPLDEAFIFDSVPDPRCDAEQRQQIERAAAALNAVGEDERETIVQHLYADLTFREIAQMRETPMGTVVSWYRRGLEKMRRLMEEA